MRKYTNIFSNVDWVTIIIYLVLVFIGWISIYAAVYNEEYHSIVDISQRYGKQLMWIGLAFILAIVMVAIFLLGWPLEWVPIVMIIVPIILPLIEALGFNLTWFAILVAVNLQTAWLSPPVALSAYFLKGVVPEWDLKDIYYGMMQFMVLQIIGLILIIIFPKIALWLPTLLYGQ